MDVLQDPAWEVVADIDDVPEGQIVQWMIGDDEVALYRIGGEVFATENWCTHGDARLSNGCIKGHEVECPLHGGRFDIRTGKAMCEPVTEDVKVYPIRVVGREVLARTGA